MKEEDKSKLVEVFTGSPWEAERTWKSLLGNSDIRSCNKRRNGSKRCTACHCVDVSVLVNEKDYEAAMEVVREYEKRENGDWFQ